MNNYPIKEQVQVKDYSPKVIPTKIPTAIPEYDKDGIPTGKSRPAVRTKYVPEPLTPQIDQTISADSFRMRIKLAEGINLDPITQPTITGDRFVDTLNQVAYLAAQARDAYETNDKKPAEPVAEPAPTVEPQTPVNNE